MASARREARNACRRISREWPAALAAAAGALEECGDALAGPGGKQQRLARSRNPRRVATAALQAAAQPAPAAKPLPKPKSARRPRKWERGRAPLAEEAAAEFWVPEEAARLALERGLAGTALARSALAEGDASADSDRDETVPFPPPAPARRSQGSSLMQTLQAVLEAGEWPASVPAAAEPAPPLPPPQPQPQLQVVVFQPLPQMRLAEQEAEGFQPALIPTTTAPASRAVSLLPEEELGWELVTDPDSWDLISLDDAFD